MSKLDRLFSDVQDFLYLRIKDPRQVSRWNEFISKLPDEMKIYCHVIKFESGGIELRLHKKLEGYKEFRHAWVEYRMEEDWAC